MFAPDDGAWHRADHFERDGGRDRIGDVFFKGRDFGAWLGLVPKQISTGDRTILTASSAKPLATHGRTIHPGQTRKPSWPTLTSALPLKADIRWAGSSAKSWASKFGGYKAQAADAGVEGNGGRIGAAQSWEVRDETY